MNLKMVLMDGKIQLIGTIAEPEKRYKQSEATVIRRIEKVSKAIEKINYLVNTLNPEHTELVAKCLERFLSDPKLLTHSSKQKFTVVVFEPKS